MKLVEATGRGFALGRVPEGEALLAVEEGEFVRVESGRCALLVEAVGPGLFEGSHAWRARFLGRDANLPGVVFDAVWGEAEADTNCPRTLLVARSFCAMVVDEYMPRSTDYLLYVKEAATGDESSQFLVWVFALMKELTLRLLEEPLDTSWPLELL